MKEFGVVKEFGVGKEFGVVKEFNMNMSMNEDPLMTPPGPSSAGPQDRESLDQEKRLRREIANSNERRRMQSINAGFQGLRNLLPHHEGEKLSKAAILQQTAEYIHQLEQEKARLMTQNSQLMKRFNNGSSSATPGTSGVEGGAGQPGGAVFSSPHSPSGGEQPPAIIKRRKTLDGSVESADEGIGSMSPDHNGEEYRNEVAELRRETMGLRTQLERERRHRLSLEDMLSTMRHQNTSQQQIEEQRIIIKREEEEEQRHHHHQHQHQQHQQIMEQQIVYVQQPQQPQAPPQPVHVKYEPQPERMQTVEEGEGHHRVPTPVRNSYDDYRVRHNLNSIVEAIRQLEGDHLFADDRSPNTPRSSVSPPSASPQRMEICPSNSPPQHRGYTVSVAAPSSTQPTTLTYHCSEVPLALTSPANNNPNPAHHEQIHSGAGVLTSRPMYQPSSATVIPVSTTVTSLKHHVLNRLARSGEMDEQPINLEYRPVSRTPSPPPSHCLQQQQQIQHHPHHLSAPQQTHSSVSQSQFHLQQQLRPGVIVVKHS